MVCLLEMSYNLTANIFVLLIILDKELMFKRKAWLYDIAANCISFKSWYANTNILFLSIIFFFHRGFIYLSGIFWKSSVRIPLRSIEFSDAI